MSDNEYTVTQKEAADFLSVSTKSISRYRKRGLPHKLILNPVTGKQEVRFRYADLERWDEGRQLLAAYPRDGEQASDAKAAVSARSAAPPELSNSFLNDLLVAYKDQIELLREQLEDMREQLARRDRQIDDLMRLMVGLQLEYKPMPVETRTDAETIQGPVAVSVDFSGQASDDLYEMVEIPQPIPQAASSAPLEAQTASTTPPQVANQKIFSRDQLSTSIARLRQKGKSYEEIARGLNQINVATLSGQPQWTILEVQTLLPALVVDPLRGPLRGPFGAGSL